MIKSAIMLLLVLAGLGIFARLRQKARRSKHQAALGCRSCGRPALGRGPCPCGAAGRG